MRRWATPLLAALLVLDLVVLVFGVRSRDGDLPPFQRGAEATYAASPSASSTTDEESDADLVQGPLMLGANADGLVVRATRGACESRFENPTHVWVGHLDEVGLQPVEVPTLLEVLGMVVRADGTIQLAGLDESCDSATVVSSDDGATWTSSDVVDVWQLSPDTLAQNLTGPAGKTVKLDCVPSQVVNGPAPRATVSCAEAGSFYLVGGGSRATGISAPGFTSVVATPRPGQDDAFYVFGSEDTCRARVSTVTLGAKSAQAGACFDGNRAALAIATSGDRVVVQVGGELMVSDDDGASFTLVGPSVAASG